MGFRWRFSQQNQSIDRWNWHCTHQGLNQQWRFYQQKCWYVSRKNAICQTMNSLVSQHLVFECRIPTVHQAAKKMPKPFPRTLINHVNHISADPGWRKGERVREEEFMIQQPGSSSYCYYYSSNRSKRTPCNTAAGKAAAAAAAQEQQEQPRIFSSRRKK